MKLILIKLYFKNLVIKCTFFFLQTNENKEIIFSVLEMFYAFSQTVIDNLEKSDFNTRTCLLASRLFNYSFETNVKTK